VSRSVCSIPQSPLPAARDFEPKGEVARRFGVYDTESGMAKRALFVIDGEGTIQWSYVAPVAVNPGADGILVALESMERVGAAA
jgi:alkyl hydroperoxide reductase subunit AhpC